ncbi:pentatricopeptide repeat-containing protein At4g02750-like [Selaginella moellendorffii]|uniref:pentatricopeptide repeat-containing protein At4g02750-like n=1 Tax=Selaginella moellendorffii TaxID=88036 RepID=UPI000D1C5B70|nr:pentatricopeptide repeat-containing protein At4g02750-like [Selaginella moellendorffii]|eukprot:XP_024540241.1 pentatricopeptide repeat-containing protein At4g02750-like [Selaginella moellendorffii]
MYGRFGRAEEASKIFLASSSSRAPDLILVTAMVAAHAQSGQNKDALELFARMDLDGVQPDCKALSAIVDACSSSAEWKIIHRNMLEAGIVPDLALGTALINLYGKSGGIKEARAVFLSMEERNEVSWTAMVAAFAQTGHTAEALGFFLAMNVEGIYPDAITFVSVLSACSHGGKKSLARDYFLALQIDYGYLPGLSHFACLVDALGRSGELENAQALMRVMPFVPDGLAWITLVGACAVHGDWHRAVAAGVDSVTLNSESSAPYVLLYNILGFLEP